MTNFCTVPDARLMLANVVVSQQAVKTTEWYLNFMEHSWAQGQHSLLLDGVIVAAVRSGSNPETISYCTF